MECCSDGIEMMPAGLLKTLREKHNTIIKTSRVKDIIRQKYNKSHNTNWDDMEFSLLWTDEEYDMLIKNYMNDISNIIGKPIDYSLLPGVDAVAVDCYLIKVVKA